MERPSYEEAKQAKEVLLKYLKNYVNNYDDITVNRIEKPVYLALTQDYFLD